jgi:hypothetical protein
VAEVSLDGLSVEMAHALDLAEATKRIEEAARDLSQGSLKRQNPVVALPAPNRVLLKGKSDRGSHFEADIEVAERRIVVQIRGALTLSLIEMGLAGGSAGVRRRVQAEVERALKERLEAA